MPGDSARTSRAATCEEWDEDAQTTLPDTRTSANVAAKRSKPELVATRSHRTRAVGGDEDKMSGTHKGTQDDALRKKEKRTSGLKLTTSFPERESRRYSSGPPREPPKLSTSRAATKPAASKAETLEPLTTHRPGDCCVCDRYGYHVMIASDARVSSKEAPLPPTPVATFQQLPQQAPQTTNRPGSSKGQAQPRLERPQAYRDQRPVSYHAGTSYDSHPSLFSHFFGTPDWSIPPTPISAYPIPYAQTPTTPFPNQYPEYPPTFHAQYPPQATLPTKRRPSVSRRGTTTRAEPVVKQGPISRDQPALTRTSSQREHRRSRNPSISRDVSLSREEDAKLMPPPASIPASRRPNMTKANTSNSNPVSYQSERSSSQDGFTTAQLPFRDRNDPPSSYRERPPSSYYNSAQDRPAPLKSKTYQEGTRITKVNSAGPGLDRRMTFSGAERHEVEAENYQRLRSNKVEPLTTDAITKFSRHSDSGSQRSINSSSRASSGGKTKGTTANNDITLTVNGLTLGFSGDCNDVHSIRIKPKANGGLDISVDEYEPADQDNKVTTLQKRDNSTTSSSKQSRKGSVKEVRMSRAHSLDRGVSQGAKASGWSSPALFDDSPGYGYGYG
jgi:hypothetical protein